MMYHYLKLPFTFTFNSSNSARILIKNNISLHISLYKITHKSYHSVCKANYALQKQRKFCHPVRFTPLYVSPQWRFIWGWLNSIFNRVDESRILDAGPDRACAEWLLRCGAGVKWMNSERFVTDYNSLPVGGAKMFKIEEVDGTDSAVMHIGFPHFRNCRHIRRIVLHRATYVDDEALKELKYLKNTLKELQISSCGNVSREGLNALEVLKKLEYLLLYDLPLITNKEEVIRDLEAALPNCTVCFPYAQASEKPQENNEAT